MLKTLLQDKVEDGLSIADIRYRVEAVTGIQLADQTVRNHLGGSRASTEALKGYKGAFGWSYDEMIEGE